MIVLILIIFISSSVKIKMIAEIQFNLLEIEINRNSVIVRIILKLNLIKR